MDRLGDRFRYTYQNSPNRVGNNSDWTYIASGGTAKTCGIRNNGQLFCWGYTQT